MGNITEMNSIKEIAERLADIMINPNSAIGFAEGLYLSLWILVIWFGGCLIPILAITVKQNE